MCPLCGGSEYHHTTLAEEVYDPTGIRCLDCGETWRPMQHPAPLCSACGSASLGDAYPEIPGLEHDPGLALILAVESEIPRIEGAVDFRAMLAWLRFHGVRTRGEILVWHWFFRGIGSIRSRIIEEMTAPAPTKDGGEEEWAPTSS